jgi:tetratricopeptide (TPR) repeat protein
MRLDRQPARLEGGGLPTLTRPGKTVSRWRVGVLFVMLAGMFSVPAALVVRHSNGARNTTVVRPPVAAPPSMPLPAPPILSAGERFATLQSQGTKKADQGELAEAAGLFRRALELRPNDPETWNSLGVVLVSQGEIAHGIDAFTRALRADPDHASAHRNLAIALDRQGRSAAAVSHYQAFLRLATADTPGRPDVERRLAEVSASKSEP